jgi:hypothetical protein
MVFPEFSLLAGALRGHRGRYRIRTAKRKVLENHVDFACIDIFAANYRSSLTGKPAAKRALKISKFDQSDRSIDIAFYMISFLN